MSDPNSAQPPVKTSLGAKLLLIGLGIFVLLLLLAATEGILGLVGYGPPKELFIEQDLAGEPTYFFNRRISELFFPSWATKPPGYELLPAEAAPDQFRLIALGASTTVGDPFGGQIAYPRLVKEMLADVAPSPRYEVANCGVVAISSLDVLLLGKKALDYEPDALLVYTGHNEAYGADGVDTPVQKAFTSRGAAKFWLWFRNLRLVRAVRSAVAAVHPAGGGDGAQGEGGAGDEKTFGMWLMKDRYVPACSDKHDRLLRFYRENLLELLGAARAKGVDVILCTLLSNRRDQSPMGSVHGCDFPASQEPAWSAAFGAGKQHMRTRDWPAAIEAFEQCRDLDPEYAEVRFRLGRCLDAVGDSSAAVAEYRAARDYDAVRFRAGSRQNEILREIARGWDAQGKHELIFVDLAQQLDEEYPLGPGREFFTEHVHPYAWGHAWIAAKIVEALSRSEAGQRLGPWDLAAREPFGAYVTGVGMMPMDFAAGLHLTDRFKLAKWPFPNCYDNAEARAYLRDQIGRFESVMGPLERRIFEALVRGRSADLYDFGHRHYRLFQEYRQARRGAEALRELETLQGYFWPSAGLATDRAQILLALGQPQQAAEWVERARRLDPDHAPAHFVAGALYHAQGRFAEAAAEFEAYLEAEPRGDYAAASSRALQMIRSQPGGR